MDQREEFSKWVSTVESALSENGMQRGLETPISECNCGSWDCTTCFPVEDNMQDTENSPDSAIVIGGVDIQSPTSSRPNIRSGHNDSPMNIKLAADKEEIESDEFMGLEEVDMSMDEEASDFEEVSQKGKQGGVKLGDIVTKTEFRKTGGENSPLTYGEENLDEELGELDDDDDVYPMPSNSGHDLVSVIKYMQSMGLSNSERAYSDQELENMPIDQLEQVHSEVTGNVSEAVDPKPTKSKFSQEQDYDPYGDMDDMLNPRQADLPTAYDAGNHDISGPEEPMQLPAASRAATQAKMQNMSPTERMRDMMNRISPDAGGNEAYREPTMPDTPQNELVVRTARDVPAAINNAMQAGGVQSPEWHHVNNLPGMNDRNIRGMGRQIFGMFTNTPLEQIQTIANVDGQGPNTDAEMRAVAGWLRDNAEDLGRVDINHGRAIPGYEPDVKEYKANGVRFHVVRDPMGQYIYAYPDQDAKLNVGGDEQGRGRIGGNMPRLRESTGMSLFEELKLDEEIKASLKELALVESVMINESSLSKIIGYYPGPAGKQEKNQGGWNLLKKLHADLKFSDKADIQRLPLDRNVLYGYFKNDPDHFLIIVGEDGVAAIRPSEEYIKRAKEKKGSKPYDPNEEKIDANLQYQVIAFKNNGAELASSLFKDPTAEKKAKEREEKLKAAGKDDDSFQTSDRTVIRTRMGMYHGKDTQVDFNIFQKLPEEIGKKKAAYLVGFYALRADTAKGHEQEIEPHTGAVERNKLAHRAAAGLRDAGTKKPPGGFGKSPEELSSKDKPANVPYWAGKGAKVKTKGYPEHNEPEKKFNQETQRWEDVTNGEVDESKSSQQAQRKSRDAKKQEIHTSRENMRYSQPLPQKSAPATIYDNTQRLFKRITPTLVPIADRASGRLSQRLQKKAKSGHWADVKALTAASELLDSFRSALNTSKDIPLTGVVDRIFKQALEKFTGMKSWDRRYTEELEELAKASAHELFPLVRTLTSILLGAANTPDNDDGDDGDDTPL